MVSSGPRIGTIIALIAVRRFRHVFAVLLAIILVQVVVDNLQIVIGRPRPFFPIIGDWEGPSHPSGPVARFGVTAAAMAYTLVPRGRQRHLAFGLAGVLVSALVLALRLISRSTIQPTPWSRRSSLLPL